MWEQRCLQGCIWGSQTFYWTSHTVSELRVREGWVVQGMEEGAGVLSYLTETMSRCSVHIVHIRIFTQVDLFSTHVQNVQDSVMSRFMLLEWSLHSPGGGGLPFDSEAWRAAHSEFLQS